MEPGHLGWTVMSVARLAVSVIRDTKGTLFTGSGNVTRDAVWKRLEGEAVALGEVATVNFGKQLRDRRKYHRDVITVDSVDDLGSNYRPCYTGRDVQHYRVTWTGLAVWTASKRGLVDAGIEASRTPSTNSLRSRSESTPTTPSTRVAINA